VQDEDVTTTAPDTIHWLEASDGQELPYRYFPADPATRRGSLVYQHGIQSHGAWYTETAAELARRGYSFYLPDRRGSGLSTGPPGWFGPYRQLIDDVGSFVEHAREQEDGAPVFLVGGCWGARPAVAYALEAQDELAGLSLICPALKAQVDVPSKDKVRVGVGRLVDQHRKIPVPLTPELFTRNPERLEFIRTDPLSLHEVTARFFFETAIWDPKLLRATSLRLPLLLQQAGDDRIIDRGTVRAWFDRQAARDKEFVLYPEFGHILDFEDERRRYWDDLADWLDRRS
jgi:alpha-beta hydrolase superfamily lysophospholipase